MAAAAAAGSPSAAADQPAPAPSDCVVIGIPDSWRSADVREFFEHFRELGPGFLCFHYLHRKVALLPPSSLDTAGSAAPSSTATSSSTSSTSTTSTPSAKHENPSTTTAASTKEQGCCVVRLASTAVRQQFIREYGGESWCADRPKHRVVIQELAPGHPLCDLPELHPPPLLPNGNVGTPTPTLLEHVRQCRLPASVVGKLRLNSSRNRRPVYGQVPLDYGESPGAAAAEPKPAPETGDKAKSSAGTRARSMPLKPLTHNRDAPPRPRAEGEEDDEEREEREEDGDSDDEEEGWDRHLALHPEDADAAQDRAKERLYERDESQPWEKGGPGLVFYTDALFWDRQQGSFEDRTADDHDIDMSAYTEGPLAADREGQELWHLHRRHPEHFRNPGRRGRYHQPDLDESEADIARFEAHTKGFGSRIMRRLGWTEGAGIGAREGRAVPIEAAGQAPTQRRGIGYFGEKLDRSSSGVRAKRRRGEQPSAHIGSAFDHKLEDS